MIGARNIESNCHQPSTQYRQIDTLVYRPPLDTQWIQRKQTIVMRDGVAFKLDLSEMIDACIQMSAVECGVQHAIGAPYQLGTIALNIGSNVGAHTLPLWKTAGKGGRRVCV